MLPLDVTLPEGGISTETTNFSEGEAKGIGLEANSDVSTEVSETIVDSSSVELTLKGGCCVFSISVVLETGNEDVKISFLTEPGAWLTAN